MHGGGRGNPTPCKMGGEAVREGKCPGGKSRGGCPDPVDYEPGQPKTRDERSEAAWAKQPSGGTAGGPHHIAALSIKLIKPPRRGNELYRYCTEPYVANT